MEAAPQRKYVIATDVGGTCTDTVVFAAGEPIRIGKALSTPPRLRHRHIRFNPLGGHRHGRRAG